MFYDQIPLARHEPDQPAREPRIHQIRIKPKCAFDKCNPCINIAGYKGKRRTAPAQYLRIVLTELDRTLG
jgi:galactose-1-phosphate uridylyltransferase